MPVKFKTRLFIWGGSHAQAHWGGKINPGGAAGYWSFKQSPVCWMSGLFPKSQMEHENKKKKQKKPATVGSFFFFFLTATFAAGKWVWFCFALFCFVLSFVLFLFVCSFVHLPVFLFVC
jgi:hypothetical protein